MQKGKIPIVIPDMYTYRYSIRTTTRTFYEYDERPMKGLLARVSDFATRIFADSNSASVLGRGLIVL